VAYESSALFSLFIQQVVFGKGKVLTTAAMQKTHRVWQADGETSRQWWSVVDKPCGGGRCGARRSGSCVCFSDIRVCIGRLLQGEPIPTSAANLAIFSTAP